MTDNLKTRGIPPRPWKRQRQYILDADGVVIATVMGRDTDYDRREMDADGDFIVRTVNNLSLSLHMLRCFVAAYDTLETTPPILKRAKQLISEMEKDNEP